ncbi:MFS transporter [Rhodobacteraceae bacterium N5(2021)]|uniref:MFS transporter n=1 Tax=Gymnodinialimonas phycosphaerae TaxID=2841589 RepID=A0A975TT10_9RHOB|nr:MFS transporter [Gymnodinialimonas phycosphaerae]MBY4894120.1 MFS transporter [Gymnodinialimonas phycosphaerae]
MNTPSDGDITSERSLIAIMSATNFVIGMGAFMVIGMLPPLAADLGLSVSLAGWVMTIYAIAYAVTSPLLVSATGRVGRRKVLFAGLSIFAMANLLAALAPNEGVLFIARALAAVGAGITTPVTAAVVAGVVAPQQRARSLASVMFGLTLAQVIGVPAGGFVAFTFGWRFAFLIVAIIALPCLFLIWTRVPRGLHFQPVGLRDLGAVIADGPIMLAILVTATFLGAIYVPLTFLASLLEEVMGYGRNGISGILLCLGLAAVFGNLLGGWMADRFGPTRTLLFLALTQIVAMPLFSTLPMAGWLLFTLVFVWSTFGWSITAPQQARIISLRPERAPVVLSLNAAAIYIGAALGSAIGGAVIAGHGLIALGIAGGLGAAIALANIILSARISG